MGAFEQMFTQLTSLGTEMEYMGEQALFEEVIDLRDRLVDQNPQGRYALMCIDDYWGLAFLCNFEEESEYEEDRRFTSDNLREALVLQRERQGVFSSFTYCVIEV